jgi:uncharacterized protein YchJ
MNQKDETREHVMKTTNLVHGLVCAVALGAGVLGFAACGGGGSDAAQIKSREQQGLKAMQHRDWKTLAKLVSPRSGCTEDDLKGYYNASFDEAGVDPAKIGIKISSVEVDKGGTTAQVHYSNTYDGEQAGAASDDWVKVDGTWYLDEGGEVGCTGKAAATTKYDDDSEEAAIQKRIDAEFDAMRDEDWGKVYGFLSERSREDCSKSEFAIASADTSDAPDGFEYSKIGYRDLKIAVTGDEARASFTWTYDGEPNASETLRWVKSDGQWYDDDSTDNAGQNACGDEQVISSSSRSLAATSTPARSTPTRAAATVVARTATPVRTATPARTPTAAPTSATTAAAETAIRALFDREISAINRKDWPTVYAQLSQRSRQDCTLEQFTSHLTQQLATQSLDPAAIGYQSLIVTVSGSRAQLSFVRTNKGAPLQAMVTTTVNVSGTWYDDNNGLSACTFS